jgi:hypothetical protein
VHGTLLVVVDVSHESPRNYKGSTWAEGPHYSTADTKWRV